MNKKLLFITRAALIAALYCILTFLSNMFGLSGQMIQCRFSEMLTILPIFTPAAIPGLFIGCITANLLTGAALPDIIFGSLATLLGALGTYWIGKKIPSPLNQWLGLLPPILFNTLIVPFLIILIYDSEQLFVLCVLTVFLGEFLSAGIGGRILCRMLKPYRSRLLEP